MKRKHKRHGTHASNTGIENSEKIHLLSNLRDKKTDCPSKMSLKIHTTQLLDDLCEVELVESQP